LDFVFILYIEVNALVQMVELPRFLPSPGTIFMLGAGFPEVMGPFKTRMAGKTYSQNCYSLNPKTSGDIEET